MAQTPVKLSWIDVPGCSLKGLQVHLGEVHRASRRVVIILDSKPVHRFADEEGQQPDKVLDLEASETFCSIVERASRDKEVEALAESVGVEVLLTTLPYPPAGKAATTAQRLASMAKHYGDKTTFLLAGYRTALETLQGFGGIGRHYGRYTVHTLGDQKIRLVATLPFGDLVDPRPPVKASDGGGMVSMMHHAVDHVRLAVVARNRYHLSRLIPEHTRKTGTIKHKFIKTVKEFDAFMKRLRACRTPTLDFETESLAKITNRLLMMQACLPSSLDDDEPALYALPLLHSETPWSADEYEHIRSSLVDYFEDKGKTTYTLWANGKFDIGQTLAQLKARWFDHEVFDVQSAEHLLDENYRFLPPFMLGKTGAPKSPGPYSLEALEWRYGFHRPAGGLQKEARSNMAAQKIKDIADYGVIDVLTTFLIHRFQIAEAKRVRYGKFMSACVKQAGRTSKVIARMEVEGNHVDVDYIQSLSAPSSSLNKALDELADRFRGSKAAQNVNKRLTDLGGYRQQGLFGAAKRPWVFSIRKPEHKDALFLEELGLPPVSISKKTGKPSLGKSFIEVYKSRVAEVALYEEYVKAFKLKTGFVNSMLDMLMFDPDARTDDCIRSEYGMTRVVTGRLSSGGGFNLQNIPTRGKEAKIIKRIFVAKRGRVLLKADYAAHEVRFLGLLANDPSIIEAFTKARDAKLSVREAITDKELKAAIDRLKKHGDIHIQNVARLFGQAVDKDHPLRQLVKQAVFGVIYAMGAYSLAQNVFTIHEPLEDLERAMAKAVKELKALKAGKEVKGKDGKPKMAATVEVDVRNLQEKIRRKKLTDDEKVAEAEDIMRRLFSSWPDADRWIKGVYAEAERKHKVVSPWGRIRHLTGYVHAGNSVKAAMNRRGPNSIIQGAAAEFASMSGHAAGEFVWDTMTKHGLDIDLKLQNMVHDSQTWNLPIELLPVGVYVVEHGMTTLTMDYYRQEHGFDFKVPVDIDMEIGLNDAELKKWGDFRFDTLRKIGEELLKESKATPAQARAFRANLAFIEKLRNKELKAKDGKMAPEARDPAFWKRNVALADTPKRKVGTSKTRRRRAA